MFGKKTPGADECAGNPGGGYIGLDVSVFGCGEDPGEELGEPCGLEIGDSAFILSIAA